MTSLIHCYLVLGEVLGQQSSLLEGFREYRFATGALAAGESLFLLLRPLLVLLLHLLGSEVVLFEVRCDLLSVA